MIQDTKTFLVISCCRRPHLYLDFFFSRSKLGKENKKLLDYVHGFCEKLIWDRKEMLVGPRTFCITFHLAQN